MTLAEIKELWERRRDDAERAGYLAPVADVYSAVLEDLGELDGIMENGRRLLSVKETASRLGMSAGWVYDNAAEIGAIRFGRAIRFPVEHVDEYQRRMERGR